MSHSLSKILLHVVFSTKNRIHFIPDYILPDLHAYIAKSVSELNGKAYKVGGVSNHIHIAMNFPRTVTISKMMECVKSSSSNWLKRGEDGMFNFKWQPGYGAFSLGESQLPNLIRYINNQQNHHKIKTYEDELNEIRIKYNIPKKEIAQI